MASGNKDGTTNRTETGVIVERTALLESTYNEVLNLVSRTADFVDALRGGVLPSLAMGSGAAYTVESMRHTTRLMQVMAWLLTQRAVETGEMTAEEAADPKYRLGGADVCLAGPVPGAEGLPRTFREMTRESDRIYRRIRRLSSKKDEPPPEHPMHMLRNRFNAADSDSETNS